MAKYRGKYKGKARGKYVRRAFISKHNSEEENSTFSRKVNLFMSNKGFRVGWEMDDYPESNCRSESASYHIGGATVDVAKRSYHNNNHYYTRIKMVSNDSLDDIIRMTLEEFPSFKKIDFKTIL